MDFLLCMKYGLLCCSSVIYFALGIGLILVGALTEAFFMLDDSNFAEFNFHKTASSVKFIGTIIIVTSFMGCCGAIAENSQMIKIFSKLMVLLIILEAVLIASLIPSFLHSGDISEVLENKMNETMSQYGEKNNTQIQRSWDLMQSVFHCCGVNSPKDWINVGNKTIPTSCCENVPVIPQSPNITQMTECTPVNSFSYGCFDVILNVLNKQPLILGVSVTCMAVFQVFMFTVSSILGRSVRRGYVTV